MGIEGSTDDESPVDIVPVEGSTAVPDDDACETLDLVRVRVRMLSVTAVGVDTSTRVPVVAVIIDEESPVGVRVPTVVDGS